MGGNIVKAKPKVNVLKQIKLLAKRSWNEVFRARTSLIIQAMTQLATAGIYGVLYKLKDNGAGVFDRFGLLSLVAIGTLNLGMASSIRSFPKEKLIIREEREQVRIRAKAGGKRRRRINYVNFID